MTEDKRKWGATMTEAQKRATEKYQKANYDFIKIRLNKGEKETIQSNAEKQGKSINQYLRDLIFSEGQG